MKKLPFLFLFFTTLLLAQNSQDKVVLLDSLRKETSGTNYSYKRVIKDYYTEKTEYQWLEYYKSGQLKSDKKFSGKDGGYPIGEEINYYENGNKQSSSFYEDKHRTGKYTEWFENGNLKQEGFYNPEKPNTKEHYQVVTIWNEKGTKMIENGNGTYEVDSDEIHEKGNYKDGLKHGFWKFTNKKRNYFYEEEYKNGEFQLGYRVDENGVKNTYTYIEKRPEPSKGIQGFYKYVSTQFNPTREAIANKVQGKIFLSFVIEKDGKVNDVKVIRGLGYGLDEEAIRVLQNCPAWTPGEQRGVKVKCQYSLPISLDYSR